MAKGCAAAFSAALVVFGLSIRWNESWLTMSSPPMALHSRSDCRCGVAIACDEVGPRTQHGISSLRPSQRRHSASHCVTTALGTTTSAREGRGSFPSGGAAGATPPRYWA